MPALRHIHTYERLKGRPGYYRCTHPDCSHYIHKSFLKGKRARCFVCNDPFIIRPQMLAYARLRCSECRFGKPKLKRLKNLLEEIEI